MRTNKFTISLRHHALAAPVRVPRQRRPTRLPSVSPTTAIGRAVHRVLWLLRME